MSIFVDDYDLFKYAITKIQIGQEIHLSGKDQLGKDHSKESFIVRSTTEETITTTTGLTFHYKEITHIGYTEVYHDPANLPYMNLTGQLETFPSEPE